MAGIYNYSGWPHDNGMDGIGARLQLSDMVKVMVEVTKQGQTDSAPAQVQCGMGDASDHQQMLLLMRNNTNDTSVLFLEIWKELAVQKATVNVLQGRMKDLEQTVNVLRADVEEVDKKAKAGHAGCDGGAKGKSKKHKKK